MSKVLEKLIDINGLRELKNKLVGVDSVYVQTGEVDQTVGGTKTFSKSIVGSVTGSSGSCTGNAASATKLQTARSINGTSFNGTANITTAYWGTARNISITDGTNTSTAVSVNGSANVSLNLPGTIKATFVGNITGNVTGNCSGSSGSCTGNAATATTATTAKACTGNAATATKLATARSLWGNNFDGSAAITGTITGTPGIAFKPVATTANNGGLLDFHYNQSTANYTSRIIESASGTLSINNVTITTGKVVTATTFNGALKGNVTGNCSGSSGSCTGNAATATKATQDSAGQQINTTYIKGLAVSGRTITYTKGDGSTGTITTQDTNTWTAFKGATSSANGTAGYVPAPTKGNQDKFFKADGTWATPPNTTYASMSASEATTGTATVARTISAKVLHDKINSLMAESILSMVYPVGSVYISVNNVSPEKFLGGKWVKISQGRVLQGASGTQTAGTEVSAGLPNISVSSNGAHTHTRGSMNITGAVAMHGAGGCSVVNGFDGAFYGSRAESSYHTTECTPGASSESVIEFSADRTWTGSTSSDGAHSHAAYITGITGNSTTVQPPALLVNIWKRTA